MNDSHLLDMRSECRRFKLEVTQIEGFVLVTASQDGQVFYERRYPYSKVLSGTFDEGCIAATEAIDELRSRGAVL